MARRKDTTYNRVPWGDIVTMRKMFNNMKTIQEIANHFGRHHATVTDIVYERTRKYK